MGQLVKAEKKQKQSRLIMCIMFLVRYYRCSNWSCAAGYRHVIINFIFDII